MFQVGSPAIYINPKQMYIYIYVRIHENFNYQRSDVETNSQI
jgi:hypothetical protein